MRFFSAEAVYSVRDGRKCSLTRCWRQHGPNPTSKLMNDQMAGRSGLSHSAHWGAFSADWDGERLTVVPHPGDPSPSPLLGNFSAALRHKASARQCGRDPHHAAGNQWSQGIRPGRANQRYVAGSRASLRVQRPYAALSRYQARLLGWRQPVSSPSGPQPATPRLRRARDHRGSRKRLDGYGALRRHRAAGDDDA